MTESEKIAQQIKESIQDSLLTSVSKYGTPPLVTGKLLNSIEVVPNADGSFDVLMEEYGLVIENGRKPSSQLSKAPRSLGKPLAPPLQPILDWVEGRKIGGGDKATAYAIANSLRYKQIAPRPFIERGFEQVSEKVLDELILSIEQQIDKAFE